MDKKNYEYIIEDIRKNVYNDVVKNLYREAGAPMPPVDKRYDTELSCAKAFLIWLAISRYDVSMKSDIVLCAMGLLRGYSDELSVQERRKKFFVDSNYAFKIGKQLIYSKDLSEEDLAKQAKQFNKTDGPLLRGMLEYFVEIQDKVSFYKEACEHYLEFTRSGYRQRQVVLPIPSFAVKFDIPIREISRLENPNFIGREEILNRIENAFSSKYARKVLLLYGMGGVGKTQIALEYVYRHQAEYSTVLWLDASSTDQLTEECRLILLKYTKQQISEGFSSENIRTLFTRFVSRRANALVVFNNADYVGKANENNKERMAELLMFIPSGNTHIIITTRHDSDFFNAERIQIKPFAPDLATEFLSQKTGREVDAAGSTLIEKMGYLPLALDYAGSYINTQNIPYADFLSRWEKYGIGIFDKDYSETTIQAMFHMAIDQIKTNSVAIDFLMRLACLKAPYVPLEIYLQTVRICKDANFDDRLYLPDGNIVYPNDAAQVDVLHPALDNELERDELIHTLLRYSLIAWENGIIRIHPLLSDIIFDEMSHSEKLKWYGGAETKKLMATVFRAYGDALLEQSSLYSSVYLRLESLKAEFDMLPAILDTIRNSSKGTIAGMNNYQQDFSELISDIQKLKDDKLAESATKLRDEFFSLLLENDDITHFGATQIDNND